MTPPKKNRVLYVDNLRIIACFLVILTHSAMPATDYEQNIEHAGFWLYLISFIGSPASELFLAISGTVLLPIKISVKEFYKRRFVKLLPPVVFWSIFGVLLGWATGENTGEMVFEKIISIPFKPTIGIYWFRYVMIGLYLFAPVISACLFVASKRLVEWYLMIWIITLSMPWLCGLIGKDFDQNGSHYWMLNYFGGFLGYWVLGYYLHQYPIKIGVNRIWIILCILSILYPLSIAVMRLNNIYVNDYINNLQLGNAVLVTMLYTVVQNIKLSECVQTIITNIAKYSFGIYLVHYYLRDVVWMLFQDSKISSFLRSIVIALLIMSLSQIIIWILSRIPYFGAYITGYRRH